jgi:hypothetical protein
MSRTRNGAVFGVSVVLEWVFPLIAIWTMVQNAGSGRRLGVDFRIFFLTWVVAYLLWIWAAPHITGLDRKTNRKTMKDRLPKEPAMTIEPNLRQGAVVKPVSVAIEPQS